MSGSRSLAARLCVFAEWHVQPARSVALQIESILNGLNPKAQLLLLCARIGYSPHASFQR